jgi:hypothetical protein
MAAPSIFMNSSASAKPYLDKLGFTPGYKLRYFLAVGYPDETPAAKPRDLGKIKFVE